MQGWVVDGTCISILIAMQGILFPFSSFPFILQGATVGVLGAHNLFNGQMHQSILVSPNKDGRGHAFILDLILLVYYVH